MKRIKITETLGNPGAQPDKTGARMRIKIIAPGPGSNGFYTAENLAASIPVFDENTQMFIDHKTETEEWDRPEGSVRNLAGALVGAITQGEDGALYGDAIIFPEWQEFLKERAPYIGVSISGWVPDTMGVDGIVPPFVQIDSVDFVTKAGAGGKVVEILESARQPEPPTEEKTEDMSTIAMTEEQFTQLLSAINAPAPAPEAPAPAQESAKGLDAESLAAARKLLESGLPEVAQARVTEAVSRGVQIDEAIRRERDYMESLKESAPAKQVEESEDIQIPTVSGFTRTKN